MQSEDHTLRLPISVKAADEKPTPTISANNGKWLPGFGWLTALAGILALYIIKKNRKK